MPVLTAVYCRSHSIGGLLIRHRDPFGQWSHCGVLTGSGTVIESRAFKGVVETEFKDFVARYPSPAMVTLIDIQCPSPVDGIVWAREQVGKGYDYTAILGLALRESWQEDDRWHCAELLESTLVKAGRRRFRSSPYRISPNMSWMAT